MDAIDAADDDAFDTAKASGGWDPFSWTRTIGGSGYAAPLWPKEYGGLSGETWMQQVTREELSRYRLPLFSVNLLGIGLAGPTIIVHGNETQKERYLKKILTAEEVWCQLFSEPGAGSDLAGRAPARCATVTSGSSTARRCGPRSPSSRSSGCCWRGPTRPSRSTKV